MNRSHSKSETLICVVDDDPSIGKALSRLIRTEGFLTSSYTSGEDFLKAEHLTQADCLIVDIHLNGMSGFELQAWLQKNSIDVPVILMTAHEDIETRQRAISSGAVGYLRKPFEANALIAAIRGAIAHNQTSTK